MAYVRILALIALVSLSGCAEYREFKQVANFKGAQAADGLLQDKLYSLCHYPTVGALERAFGDNPTKYREYKRLCGHSLY